MSTTEVPTQAPPIRPPAYDDPYAGTQVVCAHDEDEREAECHLLLPGSQCFTYCGRQVQGGWQAIHTVYLTQLAAPACEVCKRPRCQPCVAAYQEADGG